MERHLGQKIAMWIAVLCYLAAAGFVVASVLYEPTREGDPVLASFMASVIFFAGCGIVLHVIARTHLKGVVSMDNTGDKEKQSD